MSVGVVIDLVKTTIAEWQEDKAARLAAALAYYTAFALGPLLLIAISVAGLVFGQEAAQGEVVGQLRGLVGEEGATVIETTIKNANKPASSILATITGIVLLLLGATGLFGQLQDALNTIWEVQPKANAGIVAMLKGRFLSLTMVLGTGFLLLTSLVLSAGLSALNTWMADRLPGGALLWQIINLIVSMVVVTLLFALIFKVLPDATIAWSDVWIGAAATAVLFTIGKWALGLYIGTAGVGSAFGAAGSLVVVLVWVYYSAQILFLGAEFTQVYANRFGSHIQPAEGAERVTAETRAQEGIPHKDEAPAPVAADTAGAADTGRAANTTPAALPAASTDRGATSTPAGILRGGALLAAAVLAVRAVVSRKSPADHPGPEQRPPSA